MHDVSSIVKDQRCLSMRHFLMCAALFYGLELQCMAFSFSNLHSLFDKLIEKGTQVLQSSTDTTSGTKNEIVVMDILLQLCQKELANRKIEAGQNTNSNNNNNINNIQNVIQSPTVQQPPITIIVMNSDTDSRLKPLPPHKRRGKIHILRRKYRWQREYRIVIENENSSKRRRRANNQSKRLLVRTENDNDKANETVDSNLKDCIRMKLEELENK